MDKKVRIIAEFLERFALEIEEETKISRHGDIQPIGEDTYEAYEDDAELLAKQLDLIDY